MNSVRQSQRSPAGPPTRRSHESPWQSSPTWGDPRASIRPRAVHIRQCGSLLRFVGPPRRSGTRPAGAPFEADAVGQAPGPAGGARHGGYRRPAWVRRRRRRPARSRWCGAGGCPGAAARRRAPWTPTPGAREGTARTVCGVRRPRCQGRRRRRWRRRGGPWRRRGGRRRSPWASSSLIGRTPRRVLGPSDGQRRRPRARRRPAAPRRSASRW